MSETPPAPSLAALLLHRDRVAVAAALALLTALSWLYMQRLAEGMAGMAMPGMVMPWTAADLAMALAMWGVMMPGMMLPGAAPMILTFATVSRRRRDRGRAFVPTAVFVAGYLAAWGLFSVAAALAQWGLNDAALLSGETAAAGPLLAGALFVAAGLYQLTPLKQACLRHCRSPLDFALNRWREGASGALRMGLAHGLYCLGCCWMLMALLFAQGAMSLLWAAAIAAFVLAEKLFPAGPWIARLGGLLMLAFGAWLLAQG